MEENTFINVSKDMMSFIEKSPTAFQVTANFMDLLDDAGFVRLNERATSAGAPAAHLPAGCARSGQDCHYAAGR